VTFNTLLFDFSFFQGLKAQEMFRELVVKELDVTEYQVRSTVTRAYMAVLISRRTVALIENNLSNVERLLTETSALYENGFSEKLDVDRLVLSRNNLLVELEKAKRSIDITENILKFQMGFPASEDIELTDTFDELADQFVVAGADLTSPIDFSARPEYRALSLAKEINEVNQKVIKAGYMPSFNAKAGYQQQLQRNQLTNSNEAGWFPASYLGVSMKMPIFDGLERKAKLDRAKISTDQAAIRLADFQNSMIVEVENARISYVNAIETVYSRRDAMDLAQSIYNTTQIKYKEGVGSSVELTQAESELYTSQSNYINALYDLLVAKTDLDIALGKM
jgi:outer membrane protein TolC